MRVPNCAVTFGDARRLTKYNSKDEGLRSYALKVEAAARRSGDRKYASGYAVVEAFKAQNSKDAAWAATRQALSAAQHILSTDFFYEKDSLEVALVIPIVVTAGPLYEAFLESGSDALNCERVDGTAVYVPDAQSQARLVLILTEQGFDNFIDDLEEFEARAKAFIEGDS